MERHPVQIVGKGRTADVLAWDAGRVVKLYHRAPREEAEREAAIGRLAYAAGVPTPRVDDVVEIDGHWGVVFERIEGPTVLSEIFAHPSRVPRLGRAFAELHLAVHRAQVAELRRGKDVLQGGIAHAEGISDDQRLALSSRLAQLPDGDTLCHGDFHPDQVLVTPQGLRVIDWCNGVRGNPAADVTRTLLMLRHGAPPPWEKLSVATRIGLVLGREAFIRSYLRRYRRERPVRRAAIDAWMPVIAAARLSDRIPGEQETLLRLIEASL